MELRMTVEESDARTVQQMTQLAVLQLDIAFFDSVCLQLSALPGE
jgi:hypothetical protein